MILQEKISSHCGFAFISYVCNVNAYLYVNQKVKSHKLRNWLGRCFSVVKKTKILCWFWFWRGKCERHWYFFLFWTKIHVNIYLNSRDLVFSTKSNQHSTFFHWLSNRKRFAFESAITWFLFLDRPRKKITINEFGDGTHLT